MESKSIEFIKVDDGIFIHEVIKTVPDPVDPTLYEEDLATIKTRLTDLEEQVDALSTPSKL